MPAPADLLRVVPLAFGSCSGLFSGLRRGLSASFALPADERTSTGELEESFADVSVDVSENDFGDVSEGAFPAVFAGVLDGVLADGSQCIQENLEPAADPARDALAASLSWASMSA